jgi:hypothetical protein
MLSRETSAFAHRRWDPKLTCPDEGKDAPSVDLDGAAAVSKSRGTRKPPNLLLLHRIIANDELQNLGRRADGHVCDVPPCPDGIREWQVAGKWPKVAYGGGGVKRRFEDRRIGRQTPTRVSCGHSG